MSRTLRRRPPLLWGEGRPMHNRPPLLWGGGRPRHNRPPLLWGGGRPRRRRRRWPYLAGLLTILALWQVRVATADLQGAPSPAQGVMPVLRERFEEPARAAYTTAVVPVWERTQATTTAAREWLQAQLQRLEWLQAQLQRLEWLQAQLQRLE